MRDVRHSRFVDDLGGNAGAGVWADDEEADDLTWEEEEAREEERDADALLAEGGRPLTREERARVESDLRETKRQLRARAERGFGDGNTLARVLAGQLAEPGKGTVAYNDMFDYAANEAPVEREQEVRKFQELQRRTYRRMLEISRELGEDLTPERRQALMALATEEAKAEFQRRQDRAAADGDGRTARDLFRYQLLFLRKRLEDVQATRDDLYRSYVNQWQRRGGGAIDRMWAADRYRVLTGGAFTERARRTWEDQDRVLLPNGDAISVDDFIAADSQRVMEEEVLQGRATIVRPGEAPAPRHRVDGPAPAWVTNKSLVTVTSLDPKQLPDGTFREALERYIKENAEASTYQGEMLPVIPEWTYGGDVPAPPSLGQRRVHAGRRCSRCGRFRRTGAGCACGSSR